MQSPVFRPRLLFPADDIENEMKDLPADIFDAGRSGRNASGVDVNQIGPAFGERGSGGDLDYRNHRQTARSTITPTWSFS